jgi:transcriptional regulator with XRE-family HTH domain
MPAARAILAPMARADGTQIGSFLRSRRALVRPADVGLVAGPRRRVDGLRRDEVAQLASISTEYYVEIEQGRSNPPSASLLDSLAAALRLTPDEHDHLMGLAGYAIAPRSAALVSDAGLVLLMRRLRDCPAQIQTNTWDVLAQNRLGQALFGKMPIAAGAASNVAFQWFCERRIRSLFRAGEIDGFSAAVTADLRVAAGPGRGRRDVQELVDILIASSPEFAGLWHKNDVAARPTVQKIVTHPDGTVHHFTVHRVSSSGGGQHLLWLEPEDGPIDPHWPIQVDLS